jgi:putative acetyltransferase
MPVSIRNESPTDICLIELVTEAAFKTAPHTSHTEQFIVNALREAGALTVSMVAEENGEVVGHVAVSPVTISDGSENWYGLGPISVVPQRQKLGIGARLVEQALERLRELGAEGCVLLGDPNYYRRFGFKADDRLILPGVPPECFQVISFNGNIPCGSVTYHYAFEVSE